MMRKWCGKKKPWGCEGKIFRARLTGGWLDWHLIATFSIFRMGGFLYEPLISTFFFPFFVLKVSLKNGLIVKWVEKSKGYMRQVESRKGNVSNFLAWISGRLGSRLVGLQRNTTRQPVCKRWHFISNFTKNLGLWLLFSSDNKGLRISFYWFLASLSQRPKSQISCQKMTRTTRATEIKIQYFLFSGGNITCKLDFIPIRISRQENDYSDSSTLHQQLRWEIPMEAQIPGVKTESVKPQLVNMKVVTGQSAQASFD